MTTLAELVGRTLVFGVPGTRVRPADVRLFKDTGAGGLILYRINYESPEQVRRLVRDLEEALQRRLLVTVDHEGGRVVMFGDGVTIFPDNLAFGAARRRPGLSDGAASAARRRPGLSDRAASEADARRQGAVEGRELRRLGVDVNFAPVVDVLTDGHSPNIGIRSYGKDPARVGALAAARIAGMQGAGVSACAKHFPGLGPASLDPHLDLPVIRTGWREMRRAHLAPFRRAIAAGVDMVMSSHPLYPRLDPARRTPATFSRRLMRDCLRGELGFRGVAASDDLEMGALRRLCGVGRAGVLAARAGHDLLLCCHDAVSQRRLHGALTEAYRSGELSLRELEASAERIEALKSRRARRFAPGAPRPEPAGARLAGRVAREAVRVRAVGAKPPKSLDFWFGRRPRAGRGPAPASKSRNWIPASAGMTVIFPRLADVSRTIMVEKAFHDPKRFLSSLLGRRARVVAVGIDPSRREVAAAAAAARRTGAALFFCQDAHLYAGCRSLLKALGRAAKRLAVVYMRDPYDVFWAPPRSVAATAFGYRAAQVKACVKKLFGGTS